MGESKNDHFYDFGIFERVPGSQNQLFSYLETPRYLNKSRRSLEHFENIIVINPNMSTISFLFFWKRQAQKKDEDPSKKILNLLDIGRLRNQETKKPWNHETMKPRNPSTYRLPPLHYDCPYRPLLFH